MKQHYVPPPYSCGSTFYFHSPTILFRPSPDPLPSVCFYESMLPLELLATLLDTPPYSPLSFHPERFLTEAFPFCIGLPLSTLCFLTFFLSPCTNTDGLLSVNDPFFLFLFSPFFSPSDSLFCFLCHDITKISYTGGSERFPHVETDCRLLLHVSLS